MAAQSPYTAEARRLHALHFIAWCNERGVERVEVVTHEVLDRYRRHLFHHKKRDGRALTFTTQYVRLQANKSFFRWLTKQGVLPANPAAELELPKIHRKLPHHVLTASEAEHVLIQPDLTDALGVRDRAVLEVLYSTGMRRMEVVGLSIFDVDDARGTIRVREGKGKKDRTVPVGERALRFVEKYRVEVRPQLASNPDESALFLTHFGEPLGKAWMTLMVRKYVEKAQLGKVGSCHLFRHTMATLMLENGADVRFIQAILGHAQLSTTEIYTHVSIGKLKEVHTATHPAQATRRARADDDAAPTAEDVLAAVAAEREDDEEAEC